VRFVTTESFEADYRALREDEKRLFRQAVRKFNEACDAAVTGKGTPRWPRALRVKSVVGAPVVWEMTWSFAGPDGRATWEWTVVSVEGESMPAVRWRRIGGHSIFRAP
jgi:hypothetical protein